MHETLDEIETHNNNRIYSILSMVMGIITFILLAVVFSYMPSFETINVHDSIVQPPPILLIRSFQISLFLAVLFTILSFVKKEKSTWIRVLGVIINSVLLIIFLISIASFFFLQ